MSYKNINIIIFYPLLATFFVSGCSSKTTEETNSLEISKQSDISTKESHKTKANKKIDSRITALMGQPHTNTTATTSELVKTKESQVQVYIVVTSTEESDIALLRSLGLEIEIVNAKLKKVQAWVNLDNINQIAKLDNVLSIATPSYGSRHR